MKPGWVFIILFISSRVLAWYVILFFLSLALLYKLLWISFNKFVIYFIISSVRFTCSFSKVSLLAIVIVFCSKSLLPSSILTGIPFTSASASLNPNDLSVSSIVTLILFFRRFSFSSLAYKLVFSSFVALTIITWSGAIFGGKTRPWSSPWTIITAPIIRFDAPQDVWYAYSKVFSLVTNFMS